MFYTIKFYGANGSMVLAFDHHAKGINVIDIGEEVDRYLRSMPHTHVERIEISIKPVERV